MIIKVPIYCEFETIKDFEVPFFVDALNDKFTSIIRKYKPAKITFMLDGDDESYEVHDFKIITRKSALDSLRKAK